MTKDRIIESLESMASQSEEGLRRMDSALGMLAGTGEMYQSLARGLGQARFQTEVLRQAAALLRGEPETP